MTDEKHPAATRDDHESFCTTEGWERVKTATGRSSTHHVTYELALDDGRRLRTRISRPVDRTTYGRRLWSHILRDQLDISESDFWACVRDRALPGRSRPALPAQSLPAELVSLLLHTVKLSEEEVRSMSKDEAVARITRHWGQQHS